MRPKNINKDLLKRIYKSRYLYIMLLPTIAFYIIFHYLPMYGIIIAFKDFKASRGILGSPWVGFKHFEQFFSSYYFFRLIRNTFLLNFYGLIFGFPAPIILAILLNELRSEKFKRFVQSVSYLPHFISVVIVVGFIVDFFSQNGIVNNLLSLFGIEPINFLIEPKWFRPLYVGSGIWQGIGWGSIIYLAAISGIDPELYEAAIIDGAGRFRKIISITIPSIAPTIIIQLIFRIGGMMSVGFEKVFLMYNASTYETADVISTFVYRSGLQRAQYSYAAAVGLFNTIINFILLIGANYISRITTESSLW
ncbi:MAG TPA: sugar ABC transporter permease [Clostridiaceae bacterium]|nr:sugar ABC transporter permease [Clostridiaceae bacterium]